MRLKTDNNLRIGLCFRKKSLLVYFVFCFLFYSRFFFVFCVCCIALYSRLHFMHPVTMETVTSTGRRTSSQSSKQKRYSIIGKSISCTQQVLDVVKTNSEPSTIFHIRSEDTGKRGSGDCLGTDLSIFASWGCECQVSTLFCFYPVAAVCMQRF